MPPILQGTGSGFKSGPSDLVACFNLSGRQPYHHSFMDSDYSESSVPGIHNFALTVRRADGVTKNFSVV
jgi:hypothetical protein